MRVEVIVDDLGIKALPKIVDTLFTEDAMIAHGEAILRKERFDRNQLSLNGVVDSVFLPTTDTVQVIEHDIGKTHYGIITGFSFNVTQEQVDMTYIAEVIDE